MEIIRGQEKFQEPVSRLPVLPRLDCLDRLVNILLQCFAFFSRHRLARLIQLSLDMDERYNSSKNVLTSNKLGHDSVWSTTTTEGDEDKIGGVSKEGLRVTEHTNLTGQYVKKGKRSKKFQENVWVV
ncbi:hypothetical protein LIER_09091 [Lithospermum erythrorhizon]|uniref:Uncharacterized protein n=1 Tax=Lithospermum erythrorhizon TaxID=34254 RepID=A0AAV3PEK3_LITER